MRRELLLWAWTSTAVLLIVSCSGADENDGAPPKVEGCGFQRGEPPGGFPIGHGYVTNMSIATLVDQALVLSRSLMAEAVTIDLGCFDWTVTELVEPPSRGEVVIDPSGLLTYTPSMGSSGFFSFVVRVDFTRRDDPLCDDFEPLGDGFLHEQTTDAGADLARIGVFVMSTAATLLSPCLEGDCVSVEVLDWAGERVPTFFLRKQEPNLDPDNGCDAPHWDLGGDVNITDTYLLDNPGLRSPDHDSYDFSGSGFSQALPTSPDDWLGACGYAPHVAGTIRTITIRREDFDGYCEAVRHNDHAWTYRLPKPEDLAAISSEGPLVERDWPVLFGNVTARRSQALNEEYEYQSLDDMRMMLQTTEPNVLFSMVSQVLGYLHSEDDQYVRAVHYGAKWGELEGKLVGLLAKKENGMWDAMSATEQLNAVTDLMLSFNEAMGDRWPRIRGWIEKLNEAQNVAQRIVSVFNGIYRAYKVFAVDPSDPLQVAEALSAYLALLAEITGKVAPPVGIYVNTLSEGVKNMLPALRTIRDRTHQTNVAIDIWLADAEIFAEEWEQFVISPSSTTPALNLRDPPEVKKYYEGWETDLLNIRRNTWKQASLYEHAQQNMDRVSLELLNYPWGEREAYLRQRYANDPSTLRFELDQLTTRRANLSRDYLLLFQFRTETRMAFRTAREYYITLLRAARRDQPEAQQFVDDYEKTLLTEVGDHPWAAARSRTP